MRPRELPAEDATIDLVWPAAGGASMRPRELPAEDATIDLVWPAAGGASMRPRELPAEDDWPEAVVCTIFRLQ